MGVSSLRIHGVKLLLVEDQRLIRETLRLACATTLGHEVIGECDTGAEVVPLVRELALT